MDINCQEHSSGTSLAKRTRQPYINNGMNAPPPRYASTFPVCPARLCIHDRDLPAKRQVVLLPLVSMTAPTRRNHSYFYVHGERLQLRDAWHNRRAYFFFFEGGVQPERAVSGVPMSRYVQPPPTQARKEGKKKKKSVEWTCMCRTPRRDRTLAI